MKTTVLLFAVLLSVIPLRADAEPDLRDGMWEITTTMDMPAMPSGTAPIKHTQCITKQNAVPKTEDLQQQNCTMSTPRISGNTVTWTVECKGEDGPVKGSGHITYHGDTFEGTLTMTIQEPEQHGGFQIVHRMRGKRIGECK